MIGDMSRAPVQRMFEEQGFVIFASNRPYEVGTVLDRLMDLGHPDIPGPVVITDIATQEDFRAQSERYLLARGRCDETLRMLGIEFFYKAVAE